MNGDGLNNGVGQGALQINMQQAVFHRCVPHFDPFGQNEAALELACSNSAVQEYATLVIVDLASADHQLRVFERDRQILFAKTRDRQSDAVGVVRALFNIVRGVAFVAGFGRAFHKTVQLFKSQQERMRGKRYFGHGDSPLKATEFRPRSGDLGLNMGAWCGILKGNRHSKAFCVLPDVGKIEMAHTLIRGVGALHSISDADYMQNVLGFEVRAFGGIIGVHAAISDNFGLMTDKLGRMDHVEVLRAELVQMQQEHRDLDEAIEALHERISPDVLTLKRLKRKKLLLKDKIRQFEDDILPDIIA